MYVPYPVITPLIISWLIWEVSDVVNCPRIVTDLVGRKSSILVIASRITKVGFVLRVVNGIANFKQCFTILLSETGDLR